MKTIIRISFFLSLLPALWLASCKEQECVLTEEAASKVEGLSDKWQVSQVVQYDGVQPIPEKQWRDISTFGIGTTPMTITFSSSSTPYTYTIDAGSTINYLGSNSGTWSFDDETYPTTLILNDGNQTMELGLGGPTRPVDNKLKIQASRYCTVDGAPDVTSGYLYILDRQ
ncbi:MAG: DUF5004 domain-containing protein [Chitinophagales bacterium]|nr:DUF5004 domain-containing protein [Chitinophagales bacterium]HNI45976.1 DUF5004 domain-containing protein [Chitinophagales bacterium]HNL06793.1 DUF5004 domain-containing protein [Chitinophagales bacterium]